MHYQWLVMGNVRSGRRLSAWHIDCSNSLTLAGGHCGPFTNSQGDRTMKRIQQGFTLIELMIVVAIVGILAAIALPAYQDYIVRSKVSEVEAALAACKTSVAEYTSSHGSMPTDTTASG